MSLIRLSEELKAFILQKVEVEIENSNKQDKAKCKHIVNHLLEKYENTARNCVFEEVEVTPSSITNVKKDFIPYIEKNVAGKFIAIDLTKELPQWLFENDLFINAAGKTTETDAKTVVNTETANVNSFSLLAEKNKQIKLLEEQFEALTKQLSTQSTENAKHIELLKNDYDIKAEQIERIYKQKLLNLEQDCIAKIREATENAKTSTSKDKDIQWLNRNNEISAQFEAKKESAIALATTKLSSQIDTLMLKVGEKESEIARITAEKDALLAAKKENETLKLELTKVKKEKANLDFEYASLNSQYEILQSKGSNAENSQQRAISFLWIGTLVALSILSIWYNSMFISNFVYKYLAIFLAIVVEVFIWTTNVAKSSNKFSDSDLKVIKMIAVSLFVFRTVFNFIGSYFSEVSQSIENNLVFLKQISIQMGVSIGAIMLIFSAIMTLFLAFIEWLSIPLSLSHYNNVHFKN